MPTCDLSIEQLVIAGTLVILLAGICFWQSLSLSRTLLWNSVRCVVQLGLIGVVLKLIFGSGSAFFVFLMISVMVLVAGYEIQSRQKLRLRGMGDMQSEQEV